MKYPEAMEWDGQELQLELVPVEKEKTLIEEYTELMQKCDLILQKIADRKQKDTKN